MRTIFLLAPLLLAACTTVHEPLRYSRGTIPGMRIVQRRKLTVKLMARQLRAEMRRQREAGR